MEVPGPYYAGAKGEKVSLVYEGEHTVAEVVEINRDKTNRRETARRQKGDAHNVRLTLRLPSGTWDQDVEEEHLTLLDGSRFETKNYACDALPSRRRKPLERLVAADSWQNGVDSGLARSGKKKRPKREREPWRRQGPVVRAPSCDAAARGRADVASSRGQPRNTRRLKSSNSSLTVIVNVQ